MKKIAFLFFAVVMISACGTPVPEEPVAVATDTVAVVDTVQPVVVKADTVVAVAKK